MAAVALATAAAPGGRSPFALDDEAAYRRWRDWKLSVAPTSTADLLVEVADPACPSAAEVAAIEQRCRRANMAIYVGRNPGEDKELPRRLGAHFDLHRLDANWLADEDGISSITPRAGGTHGDFIPYTDRPIRWHTDGYYNPPQRQVRAMILHCVRPAASGGENALVDHEIAYILLRDENPEFIRALMAPRAMMIPARSDGGDMPGEARAAQTGPVFSLDPDSGDLHMRYTARTRSIEWHDDAPTRAAAARLLALLDGSGPHVHRVRLAPGMGLICNNVLHDRSGFSDACGNRRLLYRARFHDRIAGTNGSFADAFA